VLLPFCSATRATPARVRRTLTDAEVDSVRESAANYVRYRLDYVR